MTDGFPDLVNSFLRAACVPRDAWHATGTITRAAAMLEDHPELAGASIHTASALGEADRVRAFLAADPSLATTRGGPYGWDALTHLCFSNFLKLDAARSAGFVDAATALLDAGADASTGWLEGEHDPRPEWECALYGACGVAHHPELTALLIERGADVNDVEVVYHTPESYDNRSLEVLLRSGKLEPGSLSLLLVRKSDWHDIEGARLVLKYGADPNVLGIGRWLPLHHALARDNSKEMIELFLEHGADPATEVHGYSGFVAAARTGRSDVLELFERHGHIPHWEGVDQLIAACARADEAAVQDLSARHPAMVSELHEMGGDLLARFARTNNATGVLQLLRLGVNVAAPFTSGDGYFGIPKRSLAIHVAAWRGWPKVVRMLLEHGSPADVPDPNGQTPLMLAIRAATDSYWTGRRTPESIELLLAAGASTEGIAVPTGYPEADAILQRVMGHG